MPADSGAERTVVDGTSDVGWIAWGKDGQIYCSSHDVRGTAAIGSVAASGSAPRVMVRFDPLLHPSIRTAIAVGNGHVYFTTDDKQSDLYVMETHRR